MGRAYNFPCGPFEEVVLERLFLDGLISRFIGCFSFRPSRKRGPFFSKRFDWNRYFFYLVGQMAKADSLGQFEQLVLSAILALGDKAYGVTIHEKVEEISAKSISLGAVYVTLDRLEDKGFIMSWLSDPTPERGGRSKRHYQLQGLGERAVQ